MMPPAMLERVPCTARETASPATPRAAISEVTGMPSLSATIRAVRISRPMFTAERRNARRERSMREASIARSTSFISILFASRQTASTRRAGRRFERVMLPIEKLDSAEK